MLPNKVDTQSIEYLCEALGFQVLLKHIREFYEEGVITRSCQVEFEAREGNYQAELLPFCDKASVFAGLVILFNDIKIEKETARMKTDFISTVSHELRTPLTSIKGSISFVMAKAKWLTSTERELLSICLRNTDRLI